MAGCRYCDTDGFEEDYECIVGPLHGESFDTARLKLYKWEDGNTEWVVEIFSGVTDAEHEVTHCPWCGRELPEE